MCLDIFLGSNRELPTIDWDSNNPQLHTRILTDPKLTPFAKETLKSEYVYKIGSFMGCSCGLCFGEWSKQSVTEEHDKRVKDVLSFQEYLRIHLKNNELKLFCTNWDEFPDSYPEESYSLDEMKKEEFDFPEEKVLIIKAENK